MLLGERGLGGQRHRSRDAVATLAHRAGAARGRRPAAGEAMGSTSSLRLRSPSRKRAGEEVAACVALAFPDRVAKRRDAVGADLDVGRRARVQARSGIVAGAKRMARGRRDPGNGFRRADPLRRADRARDRRGAIRRPDRDPPDSQFRPGKRRYPGAARAPAGRDRACRAAPMPMPIPRRSPPRCWTAFACTACRSCRGATPPALAGAARLSCGMIGIAARSRRKALIERSTIGCAPLVEGKTPARRYRYRHARRAVLARCDRLGQARTLDASLRRISQSPAGSSHPIDYAAEGGPTRRAAAAGAVRPRDASHGRRRAGAAGAQPHVARRPPDPDHPRPARLLGGELGRGRKGNAWPLSPSPLARRSRGGGADAQDEKARMRGPDNRDKEAPKMSHRCAENRFPLSARCSKGMTMPTARIFQHPKNAMQSGRARTLRWTLEFEPAEAQATRSADRLGGIGRYARPGSARLSERRGGDCLCGTRGAGLHRDRGARTQA